MKIVVTGDRNWTDRLVVERAFDIFRPDTVIEGECRGLDSMARDVALERKLEVVAVPADWEGRGLAAGPVRNKQMLLMGPDIVLAFHNDLESSKGTRHCVKEALKMGLTVWHFSANGVVRLSKTTWS